MKDGPLYRPMAGKKSEWARQKLVRKPDVTAIWHFSHCCIKEEQVHMPDGEMGESKKGTNRDIL